MSHTRWLTGCLALATTTALASCASTPTDAPTTITFAAVPAESAMSLEQSFGHLTALLEKETGAKVEFHNASDYAAVIEGMRAGQIDIASLGPFSYVIAKGTGMDLNPVAAASHAKDQAPSYTSRAYVKTGSAIQSLKQAEGHRVCLVDKASTSGYLVPLKGFMDAQIDPNTGIEQVLSGGHDAALLGLKSGNCDVAFAHDAMATTLEKSGQLRAGEIQEIWKSEPIPEDPLTVNNSTLTPQLREKITTVLREQATKPALVEAGICPSEHDCELPEETEYGYLPVDDSSFDPIRDLCTTTKAEACRGLV